MSWIAPNSFKGSLDGLLNNSVGLVIMGILLCYYDGELPQKILTVSIVCALSFFMIHWLIQHLHRRLQKIERAQDPSQAPLDTSSPNYLAWGALLGMLLGLAMTAVWHAFSPYADATGPGRWREDWPFFIAGLVVSYALMIFLSLRASPARPPTQS